MAIPNVVGAEGLVSGIPGEIAFDGPQRAIAAILNSDSETDNVFGRVFTYEDDSVETVQAGGAGFFAGVMIVPKAYMLDVEYARNGTQGEFLCQGEVYIALDSSSADYVIGSPVWYRPTSGGGNGAGSIGIGGDAPGGAIPIPGAYVSRHVPSPTADGTPRLAVIYLPGLANLPENEVEVGGG